MPATRRFSKSVQEKPAENAAQMSAGELGPLPSLAQDKSLLGVPPTNTANDAPPNNSTTKTEGTNPALANDANSSAMTPSSDANTTAMVQQNATDRPLDSESGEFDWLNGYILVPTLVLPVLAWLLWRWLIKGNTRVEKFVPDNKGRATLDEAQRFEIKSIGVNRDSFDESLDEMGDLELDMSDDPADATAVTPVVGNTIEVNGSGNDLKTLELADAKAFDFTADLDDFDASFESNDPQSPEINSTDQTSGTTPAPTQLATSANQKLNKVVKTPQFDLGDGFLAASNVGSQLSSPTTVDVQRRSTSASEPAFAARQVTTEDEFEFTEEDDDLYDDSELDLEIQGLGNASATGREAESDMELEAEIEASESDTDFTSETDDDPQTLSIDDDDEAMMFDDDDSDANYDFDIENDLEQEDSDSDFGFEINSLTKTNQKEKSEISSDSSRETDSPSLSIQVTCGDQESVTSETASADSVVPDDFDDEDFDAPVENEENFNLDRPSSIAAATAEARDFFADDSNDDLNQTTDFILDEVGQSTGDEPNPDLPIAFSPKDTLCDPELNLSPESIPVDLESANTVHDAPQSEAVPAKSISKDPALSVELAPIATASDTIRDDGLSLAKPALEKERFSTLQSRIDELERENELLNTSLLSARQEAERSEQDAIKLNALHDRVAQSETQNSELTSQLASLNSELTQAQAIQEQFNDQSTRIVELQTSLETLGKEHESLNASLASSRQETERLNQRLQDASELKVQLDKSETQNSELASQAESLNSELKQAQAIQEQFNDQSTRIEELQTSLETLGKEHESLNASLASSRQETERLNQRLQDASELEVQLDKSETQKSELASQVESLNSELKQAQAIQEQFNDQSTRIEELQTNLETLSKEHESLNASLASSRQETERLNQRLQDASELEVQLDKSETQKSELESRLQSLDRELQQFQTIEHARNELQQRLDEVVEEKASLVRDLELAKSELSQQLAARAPDPKSELDVDTSNAETASTDASAKEELAKADPEFYKRFELRLKKEYKKRRQAERELEQAEAQRNQVAKSFRKTRRELKQLQETAKQTETLTQRISQLEAQLQSQPYVQDDLSRINGIGPVIMERLHKIGVTRFDQIAGWNSESAAEIESKLNFKGRVARERWVEQATELAAEQPKQP